MDTREEWNETHGLAHDIIFLLTERCRQGKEKHERSKRNVSMKEMEDTLDNVSAIESVGGSKELKFLGMCKWS